MKKKIPPSPAKPSVILQVTSQQDEVCFDELTKRTKSMDVGIQKTDKHKQISENAEPLKRSKEHSYDINDWLHIIRELSQCFSACHNALTNCFMACLTQVAFFILLIVGLVILKMYGESWLLLAVIPLLALFIRKGGNGKGDS